MKDKLIDFMEKSGYIITDEVSAITEQLTEILEAEEETDITKVLEWLEERKNSNTQEVEEIAIKDLDKWLVDPDTGNISHKSGKFFQIIGVRIRGTKNREVESWSQPIIKQHECGILGILRQRKNGIMKYLLYAKSEPGAIINPQLSPTLQATASNLGQAHGGKKPQFSEYFEKGGKGKIIVDVKHVEDPGRFYLKTNKCMVIEVPEYEDVKITEDFIWLTLPQLKKLLKVDNKVNALARSVMGCI